MHSKENDVERYLKHDIAAVSLLFGDGLEMYYDKRKEKWVVCTPSGDLMSIYHEQEGEYSMRSGFEGVYVRFNKRYQEWEVLTNNHIVTAAFKEEKDANFWATFLNLESEISPIIEGDDEYEEYLGKSSILDDHIRERLVSSNELKKED